MEESFFHYVVLCAKQREVAHIEEIFAQCFDKVEIDGLSPHVEFLISSEQPEITARIRIEACEGPGNVISASRTSYIISAYAPHVVFFVGTAAGINPKLVSLGDVVIPSFAEYRPFDAVYQKGEPEYDDNIDPVTFREWFFTVCALKAALKRVDVTNLTNTLLRETHKENLSALAGLKSINGQSPKVHNEAGIFSAGIKIVSAEYRDYINGMTDEKTYTIDMESFGFFQSVNTMSKFAKYESAIGLMVRGISDFAAQKKASDADVSENRRIAVHNAASVTSHLLKKHFELTKKRIS
jgi:nucleoside phosphorylase